MHEDFERCVRAVHSRDARFDGWFFTAVTSTRIYCRPSCPVPPPQVRHMTFLPSAAAAQQAGFRACKRCRPDASPGSPQWNARADLVGRAVRLIADGVVDREGVPGLAGRLGYSTRQVQRHVQAELGAGPLAVARAQRAQAARTLIETSTLPMGDIAFAAGFGSIRSFNDTVREVFGLTPGELRERVSRGARAQVVPGTVTVRLPYRAPLAAAELFAQLAAEVLPGVEQWRDGTLRRTLRLPHGTGIVALRPAAGHVECRLALADLRDLGSAVNRCRWLLDLDADPVAVDAALSADPVLAPLVVAVPGRRVPRAVDGVELAVRAVVGPAAAARLAMAYGDPVTDPDGALTRVFPDVAGLVQVDPAELGVAERVGRAYTALVGAVAGGTLDLGIAADWTAGRQRLRDLPGLDESTVEHIAMRALGDPDAWPGDGRHGEPAERWRPWRAYAFGHLAG
ncbi:DNA-3-methyladenine glycosylase 2 family protein [Catellatospora coxensis]|uniref:DNA-3-methyladenine glycosylase n=1 Tax=Catellatospora coxensis TaxID=310354 RepID=A0A8J3KNQ9_9ACTN|nr:AlkA N-terminal domain-containing protein [Catellatospora coxensis]GIG06327.1 DNA-3-methyladenine glycosylase [Catellatospora coxensis]